MMPLWYIRLVCTGVVNVKMAVSPMSRKQANKPVFLNAAASYFFFSFLCETRVACCTPNSETLKTLSLSHSLSFSTLLPTHPHKGRSLSHSLSTEANAYPCSLHFFVNFPSSVEYIGRLVLKSICTKKKSLEMYVQKKKI
jgi:hypothetical protein